MQGKVKWFDSKKGYGFITPENGKDVFCHYSAIVADAGEYRELCEGDNVNFEVVQSPKGEAASNVTLIK